MATHFFKVSFRFYTSTESTKLSAEIKVFSAKNATKLNSKIQEYINQKRVHPRYDMEMTDVTKL